MAAKFVLEKGSTGKVRFNNRGRVGAANDR
jgi:hypothetical protein